MQLIKQFIRLLGRMPSLMQRLAGFFVGLCLILLPNQSSRITRLNINLAFPKMSFFKKCYLICRSLLDLGDKFFRLISTWIRPLQDTQSEIHEVVGLDSFLTAAKSGPTLILLPHIGNWELFGVWLNQYFSYTAMFRPLRLSQISDLVRQSRERGGNNLVPVSRTGVKQIYKRLKQSQVVIVLPDQVPKTGGGLYVEFFGQAVLTPVLPFRLAKATNASIFLGSAIRSNGNFLITLTRLNESFNREPTEWLLEMNRAIETLVRKYPNQYQWEYKRFRNAPDGRFRYD